LFKDHIHTLSLSPAEGERIEFNGNKPGEVVKTSMFNQKNAPLYIGATQYRPAGFILLGVVALLLIGGITALVL